MVLCKRKSSTAASHYTTIELDGTVAALTQPPLPSRLDYSINENPSYQWVRDNGDYCNEGLGPVRNESQNGPEAAASSTAGHTSPTGSDPCYLEVIG